MRFLAACDQGNALPSKLEEDGPITSEAELIAEGIIEQKEAPKEKKEVPFPFPHVSKRIKSAILIMNRKPAFFDRVLTEECGFQAQN